MTGQVNYLSLTKRGTRGDWWNMELNGEANSGCRQKAETTHQSCDLEPINTVSGQGFFLLFVTFKPYRIDRDADCASGTHQIPP